MWGKYASSYLEEHSDAAKTWECELTSLESRLQIPSWEAFEKCMMEFYGSQVPARTNRLRYKNTKQTSSVNAYVQAIRAAVQTLIATSMAPSDADIIEHFIEGLKAPVRTYVEEHAPQGYYKLPSEVYSKAIQYEQNHAISEGTFKSSQRVYTLSKKSRTKSRRLAGKRAASPTPMDLDVPESSAAAQNRGSWAMVARKKPSSPLPGCVRFVGGTLGLPCFD